MGEHVDARGGGQALGLGHHVVGVDDGHVGHELVVGDRPLDARLGVRDDRERRDLGARARGGRDGHEVGLLAHLGEVVDALADVHEVHRHVGEVLVGVLVHGPHDLAGVHRRAAADGDDGVGLEGAQQFLALLGVLQLGVGRDGPEARVGDPHLVELVLDLLGEAALVEEGVGDDEGALLVHDGAELVEGRGHAALLEVDLLGGADPQHVLTPLCHVLEVEQVHRADVAADGVAAPGAAAQRERGRDLEVVQVADAALRGRRVDQDAAGLHGLGVARDLVLLARVDVERGGVAVAAIGDEALGLGEGVVEVLRAVERERRGELLVRELLGGRHVGDLADEHLGALGHGDAGELGDRVGGLADDLAVDGAVHDEGLAQALELLALAEHVAAAALELGLELVVDVVERDDRVLRGADHAVVEDLGVDDRVGREADVGRGVDHDGRVARADAEGGLAGAVGRLDHARAARGQDDVGVVHELVGELERGLADPVDDALGQPGPLGRVAHDAGGLGGAPAGARVRADDDRIAGLEADQALEDGRRRGVGRGDDRSHDADRLGHALEAGRLVVLDDADRLEVLVLVVDVLGGVVVLDHLVLHHAHARLLDGHLGEGDTRLVGRERRLVEDLVDLFLAKRGELGLRDAHLLDALDEAVYVHDRRVDVCHLADEPWLLLCHSSSS